MDTGTDPYLHFYLVEFCIGTSNLVFGFGNYQAPDIFFLKKKVSKISWQLNVF